MKSFRLIRHCLICVLVVMSIAVCGAYFLANRCDVRVANAENGTDLIIKNVDDFINFAKNCTSDNDHEGTNVYLAGDINLEGKNFSEYNVSKFGGRFCGSYQGKNYKIYNMNMTGADNISGYTGLFSTVSKNGVIENLLIEANFDLTNASASESVYIAPLCGKLSGTINNCYIKYTTTSSENGLFSFYGVSSYVTKNGKMDNIFVEIGENTQFNGWFRLQSANNPKSIPSKNMVCGGVATGEQSGVEGNDFWVESEISGHYILKIMLPNPETGESDSETGAGSDSENGSDGESGGSGEEITKPDGSLGGGDSSAGSGGSDESGSSGSDQSAGTDESEDSSEAGGDTGTGGSSGAEEFVKTVIAPNLKSRTYQYNGQIPNLEVIFDGTTENVEFDLEISPICTGNVGSYTAKVKLRDSKKFELSSETVEFAINPYEIDIIWVKKALTYNGNEQVPDFSFGEIDFAPDLRMEYKQKFTNAGEYTAELVTPDNFILKNSTQKFEILPYEVEISWSNENLVYNGTQQMPEYSFVRDEISQSLELVAGGYQAETSTEAYTAHVQPKSANFALKNGTCDFRIAPANVHVVWDEEKTFEYNAKQQVRGHKLLLPEGANVETFYAVCSGEAVNPGEYSMQIVSRDTKNFKIINSSADFVIETYKLKIKWNKDCEFEYDGKPHFPNFEVMNYPDFCENLSVLFPKIESQVGKHTAWLYLDSAVVEIENPNCPFEILPYNLQLKWTDTTLVYNGSMQLPTAVCDPNLFEKVEISVTGSAINRGKYTATASIVSENAGNFALKNPQFEYEILPYEYNVKWGETVLVYDGKQQAPTVIDSLPWFIKGENLWYTDIYCDVGENYSTGLVLKNNVYNNVVLKNSQCTFDIIPAEVQVSWGECDFVYNGQVQFPEFSFDKSFATQYKINNQHKNAGTYSAEIVSENKNYNFVNNTKMYTIKPYEVCLIWMDTVLKYNTYPQKPAIKYTNPAFCNDLEIIVNNAQKDVGEYTAVAIINNNSEGNFELINPSMQYKILPKEIKINWQKIETIFDGTEQKPAFECSEICADLEIICPAFVDANTYQVTAETKNKNYILTNASTQFTILPKPILAGWGSAEFVYNGDFQYPTATSPEAELRVSGGQKFAGEYEATCVSVSPNFVVQNEKQNFVIKKFEIEVEWADEKFVYSGKSQIPHADFAVPSFANPQDFVISGAETNAGAGYTAEIFCQNYNIMMKNCKKEFCILPYDVVLDWNAESFVYNGEVQNPTFSIEQTELTENLILTASGAGKDAGSYRISVATEDTNFDIKNPTFEYVIEPCEVAVVWQNGDFVYKNAVQKPNFAVISPIFAMNLQLKEPVGAKNAGTHTAKVELDPLWAGAKNFVLTNTTCDFVIEPYPLEIVWTQVDACYSGDTHTPTASYKTAIDFDTLPALTVTGGAIVEGNYTAVAQIDNANFVLQNAQCEFKILPQAVECECEQATVQISATNEEVVGKIGIVELTTDEFRVPSGLNFLFGFEIMEIVQVPTPMAKTFSSRRTSDTGSEGKMKYFVKLYLADDFELPENASLFMLTADSHYKLDYTLDGNTISFEAHELGKIYLATPADISAYIVPMIFCGICAIILFASLVFQICNLAKSKTAQANKTTQQTQTTQIAVPVQPQNQNSTSTTPPAKNLTTTPNRNKHTKK